MSNIVKNYFRVLEVLSSLNFDLEVVAFSLTSEFMSIDNENSLFKEMSKEEIFNLIERSQFNKRRHKLFYF